MSIRVSFVLLLFSLAWIDPADAQGARQDSPSWSLSVREGHLTAKLDRIPLRIVLEQLALHVPLRVSVSEEWRGHRVTAHFHALALDEALAQLLTGLPYAIIYAPAAAETGSAAPRQIVELLVFEKVPAAKVAGSSEASAVTSNSGPAQHQVTTLDTTPEWTAALQHPDKAVRLEALQRWAEQGAAAPLNPLTHALVDPDETVRARAQELVERVWAAKAEAGTR